MATPEARIALEERLGYRFRFPMLLERALTHSSRANEGGCEDNETLEFLGDAVLNLALSSALCARHRWWTEGELSLVRGRLVSSRYLSRKAEEIELGGFVRLGRGEVLTGGHAKPSILAGALEAVLAAIYVDGGIRAASRVVLRLFRDELAELRRDAVRRDYRADFERLVQQQPEAHPIRYELSRVEEKGRRRLIRADVYLGSERWASAEGWNEEEAVQRSARVAARYWRARWPSP